MSYYNKYNGEPGWREVCYKIKIWYEDNNGDYVIGDGRLTLLRAIDETGSLNAAAEKLCLSYRHAWGQIKKIEARMGRKVIERTTGGVHGGGSCLTPEMKEFIRRYDEARDEISKYAEGRLKELEL